MMIAAASSAVNQMSVPDQGSVMFGSLDFELLVLPVNSDDNGLGSQAVMELLTVLSPGCSPHVSTQVDQLSPCPQVVCLLLHSIVCPTSQVFSDVVVSLVLLLFAF
jgi:hypothetical protein